MPRGSTAAAAVAATLTLILLWVGYGVAVGDVLLYLAYLLGFVLVPGCLAYVALADSAGGRLRILAFGWALGYVLTILAFMSTAALGARGAIWAYPVLVVGASLVAIRRREMRSADPSPRGDVAWTAWATGIVVVAMVCFAVAYFPQTPLPGAVGAGYFPDYTWHISLASDALHHWPILDPHAVGAPQPYHYFANLQMAASSQVTGVDLPTVLFRLSPLPMVALFALQLAAAGRDLLRNPWVGLIAAFLILLVADLQLDTGAAPFGQIPFLGIGFTLLFGSPSFLFGMIIFVPLIVLIGERLAATDGTEPRGTWAVIALLAIGASVGKVTILPITLMGLFLFGLWSRVKRGFIPAAVIWGGAVSLTVMAVTYVLLYSGHSGGLVLDPFATFLQMPAVITAKGYLLGVLPDLPLRSLLLDAGAVVVGFAGLAAAQLVGMAWLLRRGVAITSERAWLLSLLIGGLAVLFLLASPGTTNQLYFVFLGFIAGCLLAAEGLRLGWEARPRIDRTSGVRIAAIALGWIAVVVILIMVPRELFDDPNAKAKYLLAGYAGLALSIGLLYVIARRVLTPSRWPAAALCTAAVILLGALAIPFSYLAPELNGSRKQPFPTIALTPEFHEAMLWIREEVPFDETVAVNTSSALEFHTSAFSEHRVFIEGWQYSQESVDAGFDDVAAGRINPFADRVAINEAAFGEADREALRTMYEDYGVRYLVIDEIAGFDADVEGLMRYGETVFETEGVLILKLNPPR